MEFVSRDSLVEEITGIKKDDMAWDSAKQTIANIDNALRKIRHLTPLNSELSPSIYHAFPSQKSCCAQKASPATIRAPAHTI